MDRQDVQEWLDLYGRAWVDGDPAQITQLFTENASYQETPFDVAMVGRAAIRQYWQDGAAEAQESVSFHAQVWGVDADVAFAGWQVQFLRKASGVFVELDGTFRLQFIQGPNFLHCNSLKEWWHRRETAPDR